MKKFTKTILRGVSQVMFQNNAITGLFFLIGIFYNSWVMGVCAVLGNIISTLTAYLFKYKKEDIEHGLYGFNGTLVFIALYFYFGINIFSIIGAILGAIFSSMLMNIMSKKMKAYTAPFVISTWIFVFIIVVLNLTPLLNQVVNEGSTLKILHSANMGFAQVMFQDSFVTGLFFFHGILINSRRDALFAFCGALFSILFSFILSLSFPLINLGIFSYNAILCSIALGENNKKSLIYISIAVLLSVIITFIFIKLNLIALTAPFVISTWIVLFIKSKNFYKLSKYLKLSRIS